MILDPISNMGIDIYSNDAYKWSKDQCGKDFTINQYKIITRLGKY